MEPTTPFLVFCIQGIGDWSTADEVFKRGLEFVRSRGFAPERAAVTGKGFSGKPITFKHNSSKLEKLGFSTVEGWEYHALSLEKPQKAEDIATVWARRDSQYEHYSFSIPAIHADIGDQDVLVFMRAITSLLRAEYAYASLLPRWIGPWMFVSGMLDSRSLTYASRAELQNISSWGQRSRLRPWRAGVIRDVFLINVLDSAVLEKPIDGITFDTWIRSDLNRGSLEPWDERLTLWRVPEEMRRPLRRKLIEAGIAFYYRRYVSDQYDLDD